MNMAKYWDEELKPFLQELHKKLDKLSQYYLGQMMFYVEHDLADGRDPRFRVAVCRGVFNTVSFQNIKEFKDFKDDISKAGEMLNKFMEMEMN